MTPPAVAERERTPELVTREVPERRAGWIETATSADHKIVGKLYIGTSLTFLALAAVEFALIRLQLIVPDSTILVPEIFNRINSAAIASAVVFFAVPLLLGLITYIVPLQVGARGVALPRLGQLSYWLYAMGGFFFYASFLYSVPETGLAPLAPLSDLAFSPSGGVDAWVGGVSLATLGFVCFAINMVATLHSMRAPGMAWRRTPVFSWAAASISYVLLIAGPAMLAALTMLTVDRHFDGIFFNAAEGGEPLVFSHLSWIYFSGLHAVILVGAFGALTEIVATCSRKPVFSHRAAAWALVALGSLGLLAWMQNMYSSPIPEGFKYSAMIAAVGLLIPVGILFWNWIATMWDGAVQPGPPMSLALGAAVLLVFGLGGQLVTAIVPVGVQLENTAAAQQDTILTLLGAGVLGGFAALHYWLPKISGRKVADAPAQAAAGLIVVGAIVYALAMFSAGLDGQPVDTFRYYEDSDVSSENLIASIGAFLVVVGILLELANLARSYVAGRPVGHDPFGGSTLEWFALSPPPPHNFDVVPDVRSPEPMRDIREAIRERQAAFAPPAAEPQPRAADPADGDGDGDAPVA